MLEGRGHLFVSAPPRTSRFSSQIIFISSGWLILSIILSNGEREGGGKESFTSEFDQIPQCQRAHEPACQPRQISLQKDLKQLWPILSLPEICSAADGGQKVCRVGIRWQCQNIPPCLLSPSLLSISTCLLYNPNAFFLVHITGASPCCFFLRRKRTKQLESRVDYNGRKDREERADIAKRADDWMKANR